jgi:arginyl-tRNA synthetase
MLIAQKLKNTIGQALKELGISEVSFTLEHPTELSHGDFACNVAMVAMRYFASRVDAHVGEITWAREKLGYPKSPRELASIIVSQLESQNVPEIERIEVAGPGFINITLSKKFFSDLNNQIGEAGDTFGKTTIHAGKKILVEHSSPNLFKPFHIGHMMNNAIGESLVRLMRFSGADVATMSFPSDISLGVAKAVFIILEKHPLAPDTRFARIDFPSEGKSSERGGTELSIEMLGSAYVEGTNKYEEDESIHARVKEIADNLYGNVDSPELTVFTTCKEFNIKYFESIVEKLGSHFDFYIYESGAGVVGKELVMKNTPSVFTESQGAIVYIPDESKKGLNTAVFINSQGNPTYEAKDIGLLDLKFERVHPDLSLFVTDHEQIPHFKIVLDAAEKIIEFFMENVALR